jgi:glucose-6-phosphate-specific signal transduction histidine kinase
MLGGLMLALLALGLFSFRALRPVRLTRTIGWLCLCAFVPVGASMAYNTGYPLLMLRPATAFLGVLVSVSYILLWRRHGLSNLTVIAPAVLLIASLFDAYSVFIMSDPCFAGGCC